MQTRASDEVAVFQNQQRSLALIRSEDGEGDLQALVRVLVSDCFAFYDKTAGDMAQEVIYETIMRDYYYFKPDDIKLCFKRGMASRYGKVDFFHAGVISEWLLLYDAGRMEKAEDYSQDNARKFKAEETGWKGIPDNVRNDIQTLIKKIDRGLERPPKYTTLEQYIRARINDAAEDVANDPAAPYETSEVEKEQIVQEQLEKYINGWRADFEANEISRSLDFADYVRYRTKQELAAINKEDLSNNQNH